MSLWLVLRNRLTKRTRLWRGLFVALLLLWLFDAFVTNLTQFWWCRALGFDALWRARFVASSAVFGFGIVAGALMWAPLWKATRIEPTLLAKLAQQQRENPNSSLIRYLAWSGRHGAQWLRIFGAVVVVRQSAILATWGDWALLWHAALRITAVETAGVLWPFWDALQGALWSMATWAWIVTAIWASVASGLAAIEPKQSSSLQRPLWLLGALWFALLGARYFLLLGTAAQAWRGWTSWVPGGWNWLSWHWQRPCLWFGVALCTLGTGFCFVQSWRKSSRVAGALRLIGLAWFAPGAATLFGNVVLWRIVVAPNQTQCEAPFLADFQNATRRAWNLNDIQTQTAQVEALPKKLTAIQVQNLSKQTALWDEAELRAVLEETEDAPQFSATLNRVNGRLIAVDDSGVYDAQRAADGRPPVLQPFPASTSNTPEHGEISLTSWSERALWAWRWRDASLLWSVKDTTNWRGSMEERARTLLPLALVVDNAYLAPDGTRLQNVLLSPQIVGAARGDGEAGEVAGARDALVMSVARDGQTRFFPNRANEPLLDWWRAAFPHLIEPHADENARAFRRFPAPLLEAQSRMHTFVTDNAPEAQPVSTRYAVQQQADGRFAFGLQVLAGDDNGRATALWWANCDGDNYGKIRVESWPQAHVTTALTWPENKRWPLKARHLPQKKLPVHPPLSLGQRRAA